MTWLDFRFAAVGAQVDGLFPQVVVRLEETHRLAFHPHEHAMRGGNMTSHAHAAQEWAIADAGGAKENVLVSEVFVGEAGGTFQSI